METGPRLKISSDRLLKLKIKPATPGLQGKWFIHFTTAAPRSVLSILHLSPRCQGYSLWVNCQSSICLHGVMDIPIGSVLPIVYFPPWCQWYSVGVSCHSSICLHGVMGTHWECLANRLFVSMVSCIHLLGVSCQSSIYLHYVTATESVEDWPISMSIHNMT